MSMASNFSATSPCKITTSPPRGPSFANGPRFLAPKHHHSLFTLCSSPLVSSRTFAQPERTEIIKVTEQDSSPAPFSGSLSSTRSQLDLLEQLTSTSSPSDGYESDGSSGKLTIRDQLAKLVGDRDDDFSIPLGKDLKKFSPKFLTISQKRNIKRQAYLDEVSQRNDSVFFAVIGGFVILPPVIILGIAILTGYVQLFP